MKYSPQQEQELMTEMWSMNIKDDPYNFVKFAFPWGQEDTPLEHFTGPREWQEKILREISIHIQRNGVRDMPEMFRMAVAWVDRDWETLEGGIFLPPWESK